MIYIYIYIYMIYIYDIYIYHIYDIRIPLNTIMVSCSSSPLQVSSSTGYSTRPSKW